MPDRRNRVMLVLIGLLLLIGGGLSACYGAGLLGTARSDRAVFDPTLIRWWNEGGWKSFAVVVAIGVVAAVVGAWLMVGQLQRNEGLRRAPSFAYPPQPGQRGQINLRAAALSHGTETDLERISDVHKATVGLFGRAPELELRAELDVGDSVNLEELPRQVDEVLARFHDTAGIRPDPVQVTLWFKKAEAKRRLA